MGLLDSLLSGSQGGYGGLLDALMYPSPITQQKPNYATNEFDSQFLPQAPDPFGGVPQMSQPQPGQFQPPSAFNGSAPAAPIQFAGAAPQPPAPMLLPPQAAAPEPQAAPQPQQPPAQNMQIGGYQMPQIGPASAYVPQTAQGPSTDISAQSRQPQSEMPSFLTPPSPGGFKDAMRGAMLNMAGGPIGMMMGAVGGGMGMLDPNPREVQNQNLRAQFEAFKGAGLTPQQAMLAVMNPEAAKTLVSEALTNKEKYGVISDNPIEGKKYGFVNEINQTVNGKPLGAGGSTGDQSGGMLAPGVKFDSSKSGEDYLNQFSPEVIAATKAWLKGDVMPSGNPRQQGIASVAKTVGQKYAADLGIPASDALYAEKRKYHTELGSNSANTAGGQAKAFNQGISHMTSLADNLERLDNSNGLGIPVIAQGVNAVRQGFSNQQSAISDEAKSLGQTVAGEVGKLFSGSAGGGVHERELTRERFDTVKSKPQLAAALRATLETMDGGLKALEANKDRILGPNNGVDFISSETRQNIAKIQGAIDRLEGKSSGNQTKTGVSWSIVH